MLEEYFIGGALAKAGVVICQINVELHGPLNSLTQFTPFRDGYRFSFSPDRALLKYWAENTPPPRQGLPAPKTDTIPFMGEA